MYSNIYISIVINKLKGFLIQHMNMMLKIFFYYQFQYFLNIMLIILSYNKLRKKIHSKYIDLLLLLILIQYGRYEYNIHFYKIIK